MVSFPYKRDVPVTILYLIIYVHTNIYLNHYRQVKSNVMLVKGHFGSNNDLLPDGGSSISLIYADLSLIGHL